MKLKWLLKGLEEIEVKGSKEVEITGLSTDSRTTAPGHLFLARSGAHFDGAEFIPQALASGAVAIATDLYDPFSSVPQLIHPNPTALEATLASRFYHAPSKELFMVGVTGTKGKTTTSYMIWHLLGGMERCAGLIGTVETIVGAERFSSSFTSHMAIQNQKLLREMVSRGARSAVLEVSSHGLEQRRMDQIEWDVALFTNLHADHLDYHKTIEAYAAAKKKLFSQLDASSKKKKRAVVNRDSPWASFMQKERISPVWTFGIETKGDVEGSDLRFHAKGSSFKVEFQGQKVSFELPLMGRFNVYNALAATGVALEAGLTLGEISERLSQFKAVPGRLEQVVNGLGIGVFVDYAHTGEALKNVLSTLREMKPKRLLCVFGCGGDRDPARRFEMGAAASELADFSIVTSDNPRSEDPSLICSAIVKGFSHLEKASVILDRKEAIRQVLSMAEEGDIVLIAGKGHEKVQIFSHQTLAFDDVEEARVCLRHRENR
jgi:UDP-N-acetylmuramoyl-L-alanyl-D-glutamate--2,6-diaminopimelate ligase